MNTMRALGLLVAGVTLGGANAQTPGWDVPVPSTAAPAAAKQTTSQKAESVNRTERAASTRVRAVPSPAVSEPQPSQLTRDLVKAVENGNWPIAEALISQGADINCRNCAANPILLRLAVIGPTHVEWALAHGANPRITRAEDGLSALSQMVLASYGGATWGSAQEYQMGIKALLAAGADPRAAEDHGWTTLHFLASKIGWYVSTSGLYGGAGRWRELLDLMLLHGANINAQDKQGRTPLMEALSQTCDVNAIKVLIAVGADASIKDVQGKTAYDLAYARALQGDQRCNDVMRVLRAG